MQTHGEMKNNFKNKTREKPLINKTWLNEFVITCFQGINALTEKIYFGFIFVFPGIVPTDYNLGCQGNENENENENESESP